jgi:hypothetical protein
MQLALSVGAMLGIGGGAAATGGSLMAVAGIAGATTWVPAAALGAGTLTAAAGGGATLAGILSTVGSVAGTVATVVSPFMGIGQSVLGTIAQGRLTSYAAAARMRQGETEATEARIEELNAASQANRDKIAAEDEATRINRVLAATVAEQAAAYASGGVSIGSGTPQQARRDAQRTANEDLTVNRGNANAKVTAWGQRAWAARMRAGNAMTAAREDVRGMWGNFALDTLNRGIPGIF